MYCEQFLRLNIGLRRPDGSATIFAGDAKVSGSFFGQSSFATHALAHERNAIRVPARYSAGTVGTTWLRYSNRGTVINALRPKAAQASPYSARDRSDCPPSWRPAWSASPRLSRSTS